MTEIDLDDESFTEDFVLVGEPCRFVKWHLLYALL